MHKRIYGFEHKPCYYIWEIWGFSWLWVHKNPKPVHGEGCSSSQGLSDRAACTALLLPILVTMGPPALLIVFGPAWRTPNIWNSSITRWHKWAVLVWLTEDKPSSEVSSLNLLFFLYFCGCLTSRMHLMHPNLPYSPIKYHTMWFCHLLVPALSIPGMD